MSYSPDFFVSAVRMLVATGIVLAAVLATYFMVKRFLKRTASGKSHHQMIEVLEQKYIGVKKSISIVKVPGAILVLGITGDSIRLLTEVEDDERAEEKMRGNEEGL